MVRLQKQFAYRYKDKEHYKYVVTIPAGTVEQLNWKPDTELAATVSDDSLILKADDGETLALQPAKKKRRPSRSTR